MYTEDEAREKWCPHIRFMNMVHSDIEDRADALMGRCIGSLCMAWRWEPEAALKQQQKRVPTGYCGLSGSPYMGGE